MQESSDIKFMKRCLDLAVRAEGMTYPNPMVGSVVVHEGIIIGEGYHLKAGLAHAEVDAINSVSDKSLLSKSTLYVSLEPCSHTGRTPPCTDLILSSKIPRIVIGTKDTSDKVSGSGISQLKAAGCEVITEICEAECRWINRRFFTFHEKKRPYITLKWAQSADGFIDIIRSIDSSPEPNWITGRSERVLVHKWRSEEETILVGAATARNDHPKLNVRYWKGTNPMKLILTRSGNLNNYLSENETNGTIVVFTANSDSDTGKGLRIKLKSDTASALQVIEYLYDTKVQSLFVEGGAEVLTHFIESDMWDEARVFTGLANFSDGVKAPAIDGKIVSDISFENSRLRVLLKD